MRAPRAVLVLGLVAVAAVAGARAGWIHLKAELAQHLLARAWERVQQGAEEAPPWPWADTTPLAELAVERLGRELLVLGGASARTLAFGPAHVAGSALPGELGNTVLTGHRDTHFAFLRLLRPGDRVDITDRFGRRSSYRVATLEVVDVEDLELSREAHRRELTLVTCYPFDAVAPGGPLRYVVRAMETTVAASA